MNTLQDLRSTLEAHAAEVTAAATADRVAAVASRARVARRRRAVGIAAAAALAVGTAGAISLLPGDRSPVPADRQLIGKVAPATMGSLGYTYHFAEGVEGGEKHATIRLRPSDEPRLVTWASDASEVGILGTAEEFHLRSRATDFDDFVLVQPGASGTWSVRAGGADSAIAVYELGEERPAGLTVDGTTFRDQVGSDRLVDAVVGEPGDVDVSMEVALPEGGFRLAEYCTGVSSGDGLWVNVGVSGQGAGASSGCSDGGFDPGAEGQSTWYEPGQLGEPGETVTLRAWVSTGVDGPVTDPMPEVRLGLALYRPEEPAAVVGGWDAPGIKEHEGHLWRYVGAELGTPGQEELAVRNETSDALLAVGSYAGTGTAAVVFLAGPGEGVSRSSVGGSGSDLRALLEPGAPPARIRVRGDVPDRAQLGFALYERAD